MTPDIAIKDFYLQFINDAKIDIAKYNKLITVVKEIKEELYSYITERYNKIKEDYGINLNDYQSEWINKVYDDKETLYKKVFNTYQILDSDKDKATLLQIIKYCQMLARIHKYNRLIILADKRKNIKFGEYRNHISNYYKKVHQCVLEGNGYKFAKGLGTYCINQWKLDVANTKKQLLDYAATNARKKELLAQGVKIYDEKEAAWYKSRNIPYNGVDYRVYKRDDRFYEITFIRSKLFRNHNVDYKHTEYIVSTYRGMSYMQIADELCNTIEDIYNLQVDIKYKLNILLYKYPTKYLNFIRNVEQSKYKYRKDNS